MSKEMNHSSLEKAPEEIVERISGFLSEIDRQSFAQISIKYHRIMMNDLIYSWGLSYKRNLGYKYAENCSTPRLSPRHNEITSRVCDIQCGEYSICTLRGNGNIYMTGVIDKAEPSAELLDDPAYGLMPTDYISQFSCGPDYVLGLTGRNGSCNRKILSWYSKKEPAIEIQFPANTAGQPIRVQAGWSMSSAYIQDVGIVLWKTVKRGQSVNECTILSEGLVKRAASNEKVKVGNFIVLKEHILFTTVQSGSEEASDLWAARLFQSKPNQLLRLQFPDMTDQSLQKIKGSYWPGFAVFFTGNHVLILNEKSLNATPDNESRLGTGEDSLQIFNLQIRTSPRNRIQALQGLHASGLGSVQKIAFGGRHFYAIHMSGSVTSYDYDSGEKAVNAGQMALGLGSCNFLRGIGSNIAELEDAAYRRGRRVWFDPEMERWLKEFDAINCKKPPFNGLAFRSNLALRTQLHKNVEELSWLRSNATQPSGWYEKYYAIQIAAGRSHAGVQVRGSQKAEREVVNPHSHWRSNNRRR